MPDPVQPRKVPSLLERNPYCAPLLDMYNRLRSSNVTSWNQVQDDFLTAVSTFDTGLPSAFVGEPDEQRAQSKQLSAALQNGKGDWFNNVIALLLERCAGIETLYVRKQVPGLIVPNHNLDGVFPGDEDREIGFLLEAKMMGTPKHANSPGQRSAGRAGSADTNKRVKELAFKSIDLKGEAARRLTMVGQGPTLGGAGGGDLSTWAHANRPRIFFLLAARVISDKDFSSMIRWAETAAQVVDAVGLYCYEPTSSSFTKYRTRHGVPTAYQLERVLFRACTELQGLKTAPPPSIPVEVPEPPSAEAERLAEEADSG